jgi:nucleoside-diphosphate-sugar epimerase
LSLRRVLVTGARGFVGRQTLGTLTERGYDVHAVSSSPLQAGRDGVTWHRADLLDPPQVSELMARTRPSHLLHLAWFTTPGEVWASRANYRWVAAGLGLLEAFTRSGGRRAVAAGSCAEYDWRSGVCHEAATPLTPTTPYGVCKNVSRQLLESFASVSGLSAAWGRIFFLYGPHEHPGRLLPSVLGSLLSGRPALCSHGHQVRDYLHVADAADAFASLLDSDVQGALNLASGQPLTLRDLVLRAAERVGCRDRVQFGALPSPDGEPAVLVAGVERLKAEVGWEPRRDLDQGLEETVEYWRRQVGASGAA